MENKNISPMLTSSASVREALGIMNDPQSTPEDRQNSQQILRNVGRAKVREIKKQMMRTGDYATPEPGLKKGGKVSSKKMAMGGKVGRGCGASMRGGGSVMKHSKKGY